MSLFQVGDEVAVDFSGKVTRVELSYDGKIRYFVETARELCMVFENAVLPLPKSADDFNINKAEKAIKQVLKEQATI